LSPEQEATAIDAADELRRLGFELEPFGHLTWTIRAVPDALKSADFTSLMSDVLEEIASLGQSRLLTSTLDDVLARMACHTSIRAGQYLDPNEMRALLAAMDEVDFSTHCPHGRPVVLRLTRSELAQRFGRQ